MKKIITYLFLFLAYALNAQVEGVVVSDGGNPIHYANVWNTQGGGGATTNIEGGFKLLYARTGEECVISAPGFETQRIVIQQKDTIRLQSNFVDLSEELLVYPEKTLRHTIGNPFMENLFFNPGNTPWVYAKYFPNTKEIRTVQYIDKAIVYTKSIMPDATFRLRIIRPDAEGKPGQDMTLEPIIVHVKRGNKKNTIDLIHLNLKMPKEGVYIGVEWLMTENNQLRTQSYQRNDDTYFSDFRYAPDLITNKVEKSSAYRFRLGEWYSNAALLEQESQKGEKPQLDPAIGLILSN